MPACIILHDYKVERKGNTLLIELGLPYACPTQQFSKLVAIVGNAFPSSRVMVTEPPTLSWLRWVGRIAVTTSERILPSMESLLSNMCKHLTVFDSLDESHALAPYQLYVGPEVSGEKTAERTDVGELVHLAKYQGDKNARDQLGELLAGFVKAYPFYRRADVVSAVPPSDPSEPFHLPTHLAQRLARRLGKSLVYVDKAKETQPQKDLEDEAEKRSNIQDSMVVRDSLQVQGKSVMVLDDFYESGSSIEELARACRDAGARHVLGLTAAKNRKGLQALDVEGYADRWIKRPS